MMLFKFIFLFFSLNTILCVFISVIFMNDPHSISVLCVCLTMKTEAAHKSALYRQFDNNLDLIVINTKAWQITFQIPQIKLCATN